MEICKELLKLIMGGGEGGRERILNYDIAIYKVRIFILHHNNR